MILAIIILVLWFPHLFFFIRNRTIRKLFVSYACMISITIIGGILQYIIKDYHPFVFVFECLTILILYAMYLMQKRNQYNTIILIKRILPEVISLSIIFYFLLSLYKYISGYVIWIFSVSIVFVINVVSLLFKKSNYHSSLIDSYQNLYKLNHYNPVLDYAIKENISNIHIREIYYYEHAEINAHLYTIKHNQFAVIITTGAIQKLSVEEINAIIIHENAHAVLKHTDKQNAIRLLCNFILVAVLNTIMWVCELKSIPIISCICIMTISFEILMDYIAVINNYYTNKHEFDADIFTCNAGFKYGLLSTFDKMLSEKKVADCKINYITQSHPTISSRINNINDYEKNKK